MNVDSLPQSSYPLVSTERLGFNPHGSPSDDVAEVCHRTSIEEALGFLEHELVFLQLFEDKANAPEVF
jgi:hypothetical protein